MFVLYAIACLADAPRDCQTIYYPQTFKNRQACDLMLLPASLSFPAEYPRWKIKRIKCGKGGIDL